MPGTTLLERYRVGRVLGEPGGFGITYLTYDTHLHRRLAMKELMPRELLARRPDGATLTPHTKDDETLFAYTREAFLTEARTLARFSHPNVVRIHDYFEENGTAYFTMEYYEGESLSEYARRHGGRIDASRAVELMLPIVSALGEIHELGVLHRDIKPANIYLTERGEAILLDFGSARQAMGVRSRTLTSLLTPGFAPFEQYHERGEQGPWTDVYGCAATLYSLIAGKPPIDAPSRIAQDDLPPLSQVASVTGSISEAIALGLSLHVENRPSSMVAFHAMLMGELVPESDASQIRTPETGPAVSSQRSTIPPPPPSTGRRPAKTRPVWVAPTIVAIALALIAFGGMKVFGSDATPLSLMSPVLDTTTLVESDQEPDTLDRAVEAAAEQRTESLPPPEDEVPTGTADDPLAVQESAEIAVPAPDASNGATDPHAPATPPEAPASVTPTVLVVVFGEPDAARRAESTLQRALSRETGLAAIDPRGLEMARADPNAVQAALRGDFATLSDLGREFGAEYILVGEVSASARASVGTFFTGSAELDVSMYRASTGGVVDGGVFRVGSGSTAGTLGQSDGDARTQAVEEVSSAAARTTAQWVRRLR